jgi:hypothetical protein
VTFDNGRYKCGAFSTSNDTLDDFRRLPQRYAGGISADRTDLLAQILKL